MKETKDKNKNEQESTWKFIQKYFPDIWQYLVLIVIIIIAAVFIL